MSTENEAAVLDEAPDPVTTTGETAAPDSPSAGGTTDAAALSTQQPDYATADDASQPTGPDAPNPDIRTPFRFRVDRTEVAPDGAYIDADGYVRISQDQWNRNVQPRLADRSQWQRKEQDYQRQIQQWQQRSDPEQMPEVQQARMLMKRMQDDLLNPALSDEEAAERRWRIMQELPLLQERAKASAAEAQLSAYRSQEAEATAWAVREQSLPALHEALHTYLGNAVQSEALKDYGLNPDAILSALLPGGVEDLDNLWTVVGHPNEWTVPLPLPVAGKTLYAQLDANRVTHTLNIAREAASQVYTASQARQQQIEQQAAHAAAVARANVQAVQSAPGAPVVGAQGSASGTEGQKPWVALRDEADRLHASGNFGLARQKRNQAQQLWEQNLTRL